MTHDESAIDRDLREALDVTPSPEFVARVRMRIASEPERSPWPLPWAFVAVGLAAAAVAVAVLALGPHERLTPSAGDVAVSTPEAVVPGRNPEALVAQGFRPVAAGPRPAESAVSRPADLSPESFVARGVDPAVLKRREPEVLVSRAEMRGLRRLIALANQADPGLELLLAPSSNPTPIFEIEPVEIVIAPITIEPLAPNTY